MALRLIMIVYAMHTKDCTSHVTNNGPNSQDYIRNHLHRRHKSLVIELEAVLDELPARRRLSMRRWSCHAPNSLSRTSISLVFLVTSATSRATFCSKTRRFSPTPPAPSDVAPAPASPSTISSPASPPRCPWARSSESDSAVDIAANEGKTK